MSSSPSSFPTPQRGVFFYTFPYQRKPFVGLQTATPHPYKLTFVGVW
jgi:hypothetical protein